MRYYTTGQLALFWFLGAFSFFAFGLFHAEMWGVDHTRARGQFARQLDTTMVAVEIVLHSQDSIVIGDPYNITYEIRVGERLLSGRCHSGMWTPQICRIYQP
jgi:hypothetical protein